MWENIVIYGTALVLCRNILIYRVNRNPPGRAPAVRGPAQPVNPPAIEVEYSALTDPNDPGHINAATWQDIVRSNADMAVPGPGTTYVLRVAVKLSPNSKPAALKNKILHMTVPFDPINRQQVGTFSDVVTKARTVRQEAVEAMR
eukprot:TRINITY_DN652_c0_g1_i5.p2 TRINITY_DN652_c0_g1~~TRINITY_DN652_c0_g1_i5.p2  ORF type:complete len:170 (+),score=58.78 TRINITY_DN652_c0_g1_i5:78-512(+)